jgi:hypothetical protein
MGASFIFLFPWKWFSANFSGSSHNFFVFEYQRCSRHRTKKVKGVQKVLEELKLRERKQDKYNHN